MEEMNTESVNIEEKLSVSRQILDLFWTLAEGSDKERIEACTGLVEHLKGSQEKKEKFPCKDLKYSLKRLVRGLASSRKWARLGYTTSLTQILRAFPRLSPGMILDLMKQELKIVKTDSKSEQSNVYLGQVMCYLALIQSGTIFRGEGTVVNTVVESLLKIKKKKVPIHQLCTQAVICIITMMPADAFTECVWPTLKEHVSCGWEKCTPDILLILLTMSKHHKDLVGKKYLAEYWNEKQITSKKNITVIGTVLSQCTADHPVVHDVCQVLMETAIQKPEFFSAFWQEVIDDGFMKSGVPNKKLLGFQLVVIALKMCTSPEQIKTVLSKNLIHHLVSNLSTPGQVLSEMSRQVAHALVSFVSSCSDGRVQYNVATSLVLPPGLAQFDTATRTKTVAAMVASFTSQACKDWCTLMQNVVLGKDTLGTINSDEDAPRKWALSSLASLVTIKSVDDAMRTDILKFIFLHAFFNIKKTSDDIEHCGYAPVDQLPQFLKHSLKDCFFKMLDRLSTYRADKSSDQRSYISMLVEVTQYAEKLKEHTEVATLSVSKLNEEVEEAWKKLLSVVKKCESKRTGEGALNESDAFELLFLQLGLQLFTQPEAAMEALQDLHVCYEKASQKKRRQSIRKADTEPEWVDVVLEMLLSLLSQGSHLLRVVVTNVFTILIPHLSHTALTMITDVLKSSTGDDEGPLDFEDDDMEDEELLNGLTNEEGQNNENDEEDSSSSEEEDEEEEDEDEEAVVDEDFRKSVKMALGDAADTSDEEAASDEDLDDEAMFKLDKVLSDAFKSMRKGKREDKKKAVQLKDFKIRTMDLLLSLASNQSASPSMLLALVKPLLETMEAGIKDNNMKEAGDKATKVFNKLVAVKQFSPDPVVKRDELPNMVQELVSYSMQVSGVQMVIHVANACLFVIRILLSLESSSGPSPVKTRKQRADVSMTCDKSNMDQVFNVLDKALDEFCKKRDTKLNHMLFHTLFEKQSVTMWPLLDSLIQKAFDNEVRVFCRTQVCSLICLLIRKETVSHAGSSWTETSAQLISNMSKTLQGTDAEPIKPKLIQEVVALFHKVLVVSSKELKEEVGKEVISSLSHLYESVKHKDMKKAVSILLRDLGVQPNKLTTTAEKKRKLQQTEAHAPEKKSRKTMNGDDETMKHAMPNENNQETVNGDIDSDTGEPKESGKKGKNKNKQKKKRANEDNSSNAARKERKAGVKFSEGFEDSVAFSVLGDQGEKAPKHKKKLKSKNKKVEESIEVLSESDKIEKQRLNKKKSNKEKT